MNEVEIGLDYLNDRQNTCYTDPEEVVVVYEQLAAKMVAGEEVDRAYDDYLMAIYLFHHGGVMKPLESAIACEASKIWLKRNSGGERGACAK